MKILWVRNVSMGFWKSQVMKKSQVTSWRQVTFVSDLISKTPYSYFHTQRFSIVEKYKQGKIDSWKFQHLFDLEFHETSNIFSAFRKPIEKIEIKVFYILLNELKFCEVSQNLKSNRCWKFQLSILKNKKEYYS